MRLVITLILGGALALGGCDSDEGGGGTAGSGGTAGTGGSAGSSGSAGSGGEGGGGEAPQITLVAWAPVGNCEPGAASDFTVTVTATDADSDLMDLIYRGSVTSCSGPINADESTINCPNFNPYAGMVVVEDDDGNVSAQADFTIGVCETSSTMP